MMHKRNICLLIALIIVTTVFSSTALAVLPVETSQELVSDSDNHMEISAYWDLSGYFYRVSGSTYCMGADAMGTGTVKASVQLQQKTSGVWVPGTSSSGTGQNYASTYKNVTLGSGEYRVYIQGSDSSGNSGAFYLYP